MEYRMGKKLDRYENLLVLISLVITYGFCYIYSCIFMEAGVQVPTTLLLLCFTVFEGIVIFILKKVIQFYQRNFYYVFTEKGLVVCGSKGSECYLWQDFQEVRFDYSRIIGMHYFPVVFVVGGKKIRLSKYVEGFNELTIKILKRVADKVDADLQEKAWSYMN